MGKYICKVLPAEECNEDFAPDRDMIEDLKKWIRRRGPGAQKVRAASAMAEGEIRAAEITDEENGDKGVTLTGTTLPISMEQIRKILGKD